MVELSAFGQNYFTPTHSAEFVLGFCFLHWLLPHEQAVRLLTVQLPLNGKMPLITAPVATEVTAPAVVATRGNGAPSWHPRGRSHGQ